MSRWVQYQPQRLSANYKRNAFICRSACCRVVLGGCGNPLACKVATLFSHIEMMIMIIIWSSSSSSYCHHIIKILWLARWTVFSFATSILLFLLPFQILFTTTAKKIQSFPLQILRGHLHLPACGPAQASAPWPCSLLPLINFGKFLFSLSLYILS